MFFSPSVSIFVLSLVYSLLPVAHAHTHLQVMRDCTELSYSLSSNQSCQLAACSSIACLGRRNRQQSESHARKAELPFQTTSDVKNKPGAMHFFFFFFVAQLKKCWKHIQRLFCQWCLKLTPQTLIYRWQSLQGAVWVMPNACMVKMFLGSTYLFFTTF